MLECKKATCSSLAEQNCLIDSLTEVNACQFINLMIIFYQFRSDDSDETCVCSVSNSSCAKGLSCSRGSVEQNTLGRLDSKVDETLRVQQRSLNNLLKCNFSVNNLLLKQYHSPYDLYCMYMFSSFTQKAHKKFHFTARKKFF